jgi:hypothetical protein
MRSRYSPRAHAHPRRGSCTRVYRHPLPGKSLRRTTATAPILVNVGDFEGGVKFMGRAGGSG